MRAPSVATSDSDFLFPSSDDEGRGTTQLCLSTSDFATKSKTSVVFSWPFIGLSLSYSYPRSFFTSFNEQHHRQFPFYRFHFQFSFLDPIFDCFALRVPSYYRLRNSTRPYRIFISVLPANRSSSFACTDPPRYTSTHIVSITPTPPPPTPFSVFTFKVFISSHDQASRHSFFFFFLFCHRQLHSHDPTPQSHPRILSCSLSLFSVRFCVSIPLAFLHWLLARYAYDVGVPVGGNGNGYGRKCRCRCRVRIHSRRIST